MKQIFQFALILAILFTTSACLPTSNPLNATIEPRDDAEARATESFDPYASNPRMEAFNLPPYYPETYPFIIEGSQKERALTIYSTTEIDGWKNLVQAFNEHYPWIKVTIVNTDLNVFERYEQEILSYDPSADLIISADITGWQGFLDKKQAVNYVSAEDAYAPDWLKPAPGIYAISCDPLLVVYSSRWPGEAVTGLKDLSQRITKNPASFQDKIITYDTETSAAGYYANWYYTNFTGSTSWDTFQNIGKTSPGLRTSGKAMVEEVAAGRANFAYFVSAINVIPRTDLADKIKWGYLREAQPITVRYAAIPSMTRHPNAARLMLDYLISQEGQLAIQKDGLTPYRTDIIDAAPYHLDNVLQEVGNNAIFMSFDPRLQDPAIRQAFIERWKQIIQPVLP